MKKEYLKYTPEELIDNSEFRGWVQHGKNQKEWDLFLNENPEFKPTANKAKKIVELLNDRHDHLSEEDVLLLWKNIDEFDNQIKKRTHQIKLRNFMRYAAILTIAVLLCSTGYWIVSQDQKTYIFTSENNISSNTKSQIILSNGITVDLEKDNSKLALNKEQQMVIDNQQVIDLSTNNTTNDSKMNEVILPFGKKSQLVLEDGTKVWLNAGSRLAFPTKFAGEKREVFLEGEAYFEVAHNKNLPFFVNTGSIAVKVLGTKFNISAYRSDRLTETILLEGKVAISERSALGFLKSETILSPNQKASYDKDKKTLSVNNELDVELAIAWIEGWFKFSQQSLDVVMNKLHRYYNVEFTFDPEFPSSDLITGKLDLKESIEQVMAALSDVSNIQYRISGNQIFVEKKINKIQIRK